MRLRVFCNYFMYTLITFTTLINIVVSSYIRAVCLCFLLLEYDIRGKFRNNKTHCDVILRIKAHCMCCIAVNVYCVFAECTVWCVCVQCTFDTVVLLRFLLFHMLMDDWSERERMGAKIPMFITSIKILFNLKLL